MASTNPAIQQLQGTWDYIDGENFDAYLQEIGKTADSISCPYIAKSFTITT